MQAGVGQVLENDQLAPAIPPWSRPAKRVEQTRSCAPKVISVGARISDSAPLASCATTASS